MKVLLSITQAEECDSYSTEHLFEVEGSITKEKQLKMLAYGLGCSHSYGESEEDFLLIVENMLEGWFSEDIEDFDAEEFYMEHRVGAYSFLNVDALIDNHRVEYIEDITGSLDELTKTEKIKFSADCLSFFKDLSAKKEEEKKEMYKI